MASILNDQQITETLLMFHYTVYKISPEPSKLKIKKTTFKVDYVIYE